MIEQCEPRQLMAGYEPTAFEQYQLEMINRARANPTAEVARYANQSWGDDANAVPGSRFPAPQVANLNEGLAAGTISAAAKQPIAFNTNLIKAARDYSKTLIAGNAFQHDYGGTTLGSRLSGVGYGGFTSAGENVALSAAPVLHIDNSSALKHHWSLFVDKNVTNRGHRTTMMNPAWREVGIGMAHGTNFTMFGPSYNAVMTTQDFAAPGGDAFLTGVAYTDAVNRDSFYTPGEGLAGVTVTAVGVLGLGTYSTTTYGSGGYSLRVPPGTYTLAASGPGVGSLNLGVFTIGNENVKRDFVPGVDAVAPAVVRSEFLVDRAPQKVRLSFSENVAASLSASDVTLTNLATGATLAVAAPAYDAASNTATFSFADAAVLPDGGYRLTLAAGAIADVAGNTMGASFTADFTFLRGDATGDQRVNFDDLLVLAQNYGQSGRTFAQGDFNYTGTVDFEDLLLLAQRYGQSLVTESIPVQSAVGASGSRDAGGLRRVASTVLS